MHMQNNKAVYRWCKLGYADSPENRTRGVHLQAVADVGARFVGSYQVKDDEQLLKKTIKRKEQAKRKTKKEWSERLGVQKKFRGEKQKKRTENLKTRSSAKIEKRINRGKKVTGKKPKKRPGFEGGPSKSAKKPKEKLTLQGGYKNV